VTEDFERVHPTRISSLLQGDLKQTRNERGRSSKEHTYSQSTSEDAVARKQNNKDAPFTHTPSVVKGKSHKAERGEAAALSSLPGSFIIYNLSLPYQADGERTRFLVALAMASHPFPSRTRS
jgi:hypothetical protein